MPTNSKVDNPHAQLASLTRALRSPQKASDRAETLGAIRRLLPSLDTTTPSTSTPITTTAPTSNSTSNTSTTSTLSITQPIADAVAHVLRANPSDLVLAHRAVAILAHPTLSGGTGVDRAIVTAMERLAMSYAFQHTAMAALQNAAAAIASSNTNSPNNIRQQIDRDAIILAVVTAMRTHHAQNGVLLRGADLIAFHLNQATKPPLTSSYRVATRAIVDTVDKLSETPQGASTALLALVATVRHISSLAAFGGGGATSPFHHHQEARHSTGGVGLNEKDIRKNDSTNNTSRPSTTSRLSRGNSASAIVDHHFAYAVVLAMSRHRTYPQVQQLGCQLIRVATAGATSLAKSSARELFAAGAAATIVAALHAHASDVHVVDRGVIALRSLLLGGGFHGRSVKPGLHIDLEFADHVARVVSHVADAVAVRDRDLASAATVLAVDVRTAVAQHSAMSLRDPARISELGKRLLRKLKLGSNGGVDGGTMLSGNSIHSSGSGGNSSGGSTRQNFYEGGECDRFPDDNVSAASASMSDHSNTRAHSKDSQSRHHHYKPQRTSRRASGRASFSVTNSHQTTTPAPPPGPHRRMGMYDGGGGGGSGRRDGMVSTGGHGRVRKSETKEIVRSNSSTPKLYNEHGGGTNTNTTTTTSSISTSHDVVDVISANDGCHGNGPTHAEIQQMPLNKKWRSVSGRWNRGRRSMSGARPAHQQQQRQLSSENSSSYNNNTKQKGGEKQLNKKQSIHNNNYDNNNNNSGSSACSAPKVRERRAPLTLSGSEMAHLSRQPSRVFASSTTTTTTTTTETNQLNHVNSATEGVNGNGHRKQDHLLRASDLRAGHGHAAVLRDGGGAGFGF